MRPFYTKDLTKLAISHHFKNHLICSLSKLNKKFNLTVPKSGVLTLMTLVQREFVCWKRIYGLILRSHERCNQKKIHQLTSQLADRVLANRFLKTKALHTTDLSSDTWKEKSTWNLHVPCFIYWGTWVWWTYILYITFLQGWFLRGLLKTLLKVIIWLQLTLLFYLL